MYVCISSSDKGSCWEMNFNELAIWCAHASSKIPGNFYWYVHSEVSMPFVSTLTSR